MKQWILSVIIVTACKGSSAGETPQTCLETTAKSLNKTAPKSVSAAELLQTADSICPPLNGMTAREVNDREKQIDALLRVPADLQKLLADEAAKAAKAAAAAEATTRAEAAAADTVKLPVLTADPAVNVTPAEKPPFESVKFRMTAKRNDKGWPKFEAYNLGMKTIKFMAIIGYAYDKDGKEVAHTPVPLSWNGSIASGGKADWDIEVGMSAEQVPATAASYELCFNAIKFDGDAATDDNARCAEPKARGADVVPDCTNNPLAKGC